MTSTWTLSLLSTLPDPLRHLYVHFIYCQMLREQLFDFLHLFVVFIPPTSIRPDMTEKLLTGTLNLNTNKNKQKSPNFEVEGAYWFGPVCVCVRNTFAYGQKQLEIGSWNCLYRTSMKNKGTHIFVFVGRICCCRVTPLFRLCIVNLWNLVNQISEESLELGSWYLAHRSCPLCRWPD